jgi:predicted GTPase
MYHPPTIFLIGEVSSGKSSLLNGLIGAYISKPSLLRGTYEPTKYIFNSSSKDDSNIVKISEECELNSLRGKIIADVKINDAYIEYPLPLRYGLNDFTLIDFPGINDSDDNNQIFLQLINNNIHLADLVIYVTEATKAFLNKSEKETFEHIQKLIEAQLSEGRAIELIIVVNKFDEADDEELNILYNQISKRINIPINKIFRCSSHKLLINTIIKHKISLHIPKFAKREIDKIFQNTKIIVDSKIKNKIDTLNRVDYFDIKFSKNICDDEKKNTTGDIDNFVSFITLFQKKYINKIIDVADKYFDFIISKCIELVQSEAEKKNNDGTSVLLFEKITNLHTMLKSKELNDNILFNVKIKKLVELLISSVDQVSNFQIIKIIYQYVTSIDILYFIFKIIGESKIVSIDTKMFILYYTVTKNIIIKDKSCLYNFYKIVFSNIDVYNSPIIKFYLMDYKKWYKGYSIISTKCLMHKSWYINNLLCLSNIDKELKTLITISITPIKYLKTLRKHNVFDNNILKIIDNNLPLYLDFILEQPLQFDALEHRLFNLEGHFTKDIQSLILYHNILSENKSKEHDSFEFSENAFEFDQNNSAPMKTQSRLPFSLEIQPSPIVSKNKSNIMDVDIETFFKTI